MKKQRVKKLFIEQLKKSPIVQLVCQKLDISRAIVYVWRKEDELFRTEMDAALAEGEGMINDLSESQLLQGIQNGDFSAATFWLRHRHPKFRNKIEIDATVRTQRDELTPEQEQEVKKALEFAGLLGKPVDTVESNGGEDDKPNSNDNDGEQRPEPSAGGKSKSGGDAK